MRIFYHLSGKDPLKFNQVADLNYIFVLNFLSLEKKLAKEEERKNKEYEQKMRKK